MHKNSLTQAAQCVILGELGGGMTVFMMQHPYLFTFIAIVFIICVCATVTSAFESRSGTKDQD